MDGHTIQYSLQSFLGSRIQHFVANAGSVRVPGDEDKFGGRSAVVCGEVNVHQSVAAVVLRKLSTKVIIRLGLLSFLINDDLRLVFYLVHIVTQLLALTQLEGLERRGDVIIDNDSG